MENPIGAEKLPTLPPLHAKHHSDDQAVRLAPGLQLLPDIKET
jgi:hypothetical protein